MKDKNGKEIKTGMVVKISGAYGKGDNGLYYVENSPGDCAWNGEQLCLKKISKAGKISEAKYSTTFWPMQSFVGCRAKRYEINAYNAEHAMIEITENGVKDWSEVKEHFQAEADKMKEYIERSWWYGWSEKDVQEYREMANFYQYVADGIPA